MFEHNPKRTCDHKTPPINGQFTIRVFVLNDVYRLNLVSEYLYVHAILMKNYYCVKIIDGILGQIL